MKSPLKLHVVCLGNIARSPAAHYLLQHYLDKEKKKKNIDVEFIVTSSGLSGGYYSGMEDYSEDYLREKGIAADNFVSSKSTKEVLKEQDLVLCMEQYMVDRIKSMVHGRTPLVLTYREAAGEKGDIEDPYGYAKPKYYKIMYQIDECTKKITERLLQGEIIK